MKKLLLIMGSAALLQIFIASQAAAQIVVQGCGLGPTTVTFINPSVPTICQTDPTVIISPVTDSNGTIVSQFGPALIGLSEILIPENLTIVQSNIDLASGFFTYDELHTPAFLFDDFLLNLGVSTVGVAGTLITLNDNSSALDVRGENIVLNLDTTSGGIWSVYNESISFVPAISVNINGVPGVANIARNQAAIATEAGYPSGPFPSGTRAREGSGRLQVNNSMSLDSPVDLVLQVWDADGIRDGSVQFNNFNRVTGQAIFGLGNDVFENTNSGTFLLRNFADTDGELSSLAGELSVNVVREFEVTRDLEGVAIVDFRNAAILPSPGFVEDDRFNNDGQLVLAAVDSPIQDTTGQYLPIALTGGYSAAVHDISNAGVEQSQFVGLEAFNNSGVITMQDQLSGGTSPVVGDVIYITQNDTADGTPGTGVFISDGGVLALDTILNEGSAAASQSDVLVVDATQIASGATKISVVNAAPGFGAMTDLNNNGLVDEGEGVLVVEVLNAANSVSDAFVLNGQGVDADNNQIIIEGAWAYRLVGPSDYDVPAMTTSADWYLVSRIAPTIPVYDPSVASLLNDLPSLEQRVGNRHWATAAPAAPREPVYVFCKEPAQNYRCLVTDEQSQSYADAPQTGASAVTIDGGAAWVRLEGARETIVPLVSDTLSTYDVSSAGIQVGIDHLLRENADGDRLIGGVNLRYRTADTDVTSILGNGTVDTTGYGLGASLTWYDQNGFYVDGQAQAMWFETDLSSVPLGTLVEGNDGFGYALSVEAGKRIEVNEHWRVTPQVQLSYAHTEQDAFTDPFAAVVTPDDVESLKLRFGVVASYEDSWQAEDGTTSRQSVNVGAHVIKEFSPESSVDVSGTTLRSERDDMTAEITLGGTYNWSDDANSVYGQVAASTGLENFGDSHRVSVTAGFRRQWQ